MNINIRLLYLYLFSFVGLLIVVIGSIQLVNLGIKTFIFKDADRYEVVAEPLKSDVGMQVQESTAEAQARQDREMSRQRQRQLADAVAMIVVGAPVYVYHWKTIQKDAQKPTLQ